MTDRAKAVLEAALALPEAEREELVERLLDSVEAPDALSPAWAAEVDRRLKEIDEGRAVLIPGEQVFAEIRASLKKSRPGGFDSAKRRVENSRRLRCITTRSALAWATSSSPL